VRQWYPGAGISQGDGVFLWEIPEKSGLTTGFDFIKHFGKNELLHVLTLIKRAQKYWGRTILRPVYCIHPTFKG
jgi:hypothetical protein